MGFVFWLRWSWRDLRRRAPQVLAIAAILGLGSAFYSGLGSTSAWRRQSLDASFALLRAHDVRVSLLGDTNAPRALLQDAIVAAVGSQMTDLQARLIVRAPVTAREASSQPIAAAGEVVGTDVSSPSAVDRWSIVAGRALGPGDAGRPVVLLDSHFAREHGLADSGTIRVGTTDVRYVGLALAPEYLNLNTTIGEAIQGQATRAVLYTSIEWVRQLSGAEDRVNDVAIRVRPGVDPSRLAGSLQAALAERVPGLALTVTSRADDVSTQALYDEIDSEQRVFDVFALLVLGGAGFAAFNLTKRVVEAQRRDIGIAMSLGLPRARIAIRTMLFALEITITGVAAGVGAGLGIAAWVLSVIRDRVPLPVWQTPFQPGLFARAALLAMTVPLVASALPVWQAVRCKPVDALLPPHLRPGSHRSSGLMRRIRLPGTVLVQAPIRRILRAPMRATLTVVAIAFVMAPLLAAMGAANSATASIEAGDRILSGEGPDRLLVSFVGFQPEAGSVVKELAASPSTGRVTLGVDTGGYLSRGHHEVAVAVSMVDLHDRIAAPPSIVDQNVRPGGIVISRKAASDLGVSPGDEVTFRYPKRAGTSFTWEQGTLPVRAVHESPYRFVAYMDLGDRSLMGLDGLVNSAKIQPAGAASMGALRRDVGAMAGIAYALPASSVSQTMRALLSLLGRLFVILQVVIAALAFLVAFNASNVAADERRREHATMFAFGIPIRRVLAMGVGESLLLGVIGAGLGLGFGTAVLQWVLDTVFPAAAPDLAVIPSTAISSYLITIGIAAVATAAAPILNLRRMRSMDLPSTLRYVE